MPFALSTDFGRPKYVTTRSPKAFVYMPTPPQVDVLIPVYKVEQHIERCLRSVLSQRYSQLRIVLLDDASPDNSIAIAERLFAEENPHRHQTTILRNQLNQGIGAGRRQLIDELQGKYALFLDSDDWWDHDEVVTQWVEEAELGNYEVVISDLVKDHTSKGKSCVIEHPKESSGKEIAYNMLLGSEPAYLWNKLFLSECLRRYSHLTQKGRNIWEDLAIVIPLLYAVERVGYLDSVTLHYVQHSHAQLSASVRPSYINAMVGVAQDLRKELPIEEDELLTRSYNSFLVRMHLVLYKLPFRYYKTIRQLAIPVDGNRLAHGFTERIKYFLYRVATLRVTALLGFCLVRVAYFFWRLR